MKKYFLRKTGDVQNRGSNFIVIISSKPVVRKTLFYLMGIADFIDAN